MIDDATLKQQANEQFAAHTLTILRDDDLYRHLRCQRPGTSIYAFDVVTWPGYLCVCGDIGTWVFSRERDMLPWFEASSGINPHYWSEKLTDGPERARNTRTIEEPTLDEEHDWEMPVGTSVDDGWNTQFIYTCYGIVLAIRLYREAKSR